MTITGLRGLARLRRAAMLSQAELAERLGTSQQLITTWETGKVMPRAGSQRKLCEALGVTGAELLAALDESAATQAPAQKLYFASTPQTTAA